ncbi:tetrahydromethanopterin S-methyltransferase, subunit E [Candidatus Methanoperedens nitroreducens]|uniref:Tetrahydromethanopterin S-methyltransferase subunit E n=1 Tax=Candidatus Methanoperedens nitratireducens TaxID=1392998 RepID=A0A062V825_9EURY|nr:tetrahydromethanopterin S-methyltransferase subunit E [Candidatus Methanoperedens nitroreducens]KCZ73422.1 tetrahydromethanopterin S-methyltransferase, subunit E [Candidatus Methanoperedens nitroreducens]MDJ1422623.1 tetrahydromethanopterin S-methyltransferase subunit E [Candidatus Methanoperedens sp.]
MVLDLTMSMAVLALMGALAMIAGSLEDLESDVGSQSNPNSQVQLAPQMNFLHRIYNKAISGEPVSNGLSAVIAGTVTVVFLNANFNVLTAIALGATVGAIVLGIFATTAYAGRVSSQTRFKQPLYMDIMRYTTPSIIAHNFIMNFCLVALAYIQYTILGHPFSIPFLALIWGITAGAVGSSAGDVHYGGEREFQNREFGCGLNTSLSGRIVRRAESGLRNSIDNVWFCAKLGGPATGIALGLVVFLSNWPTIAVQEYSWSAVIVGFMIVLLLIIANRLVEYNAKKTYGPYKEEKEAAA